MHTSTKSSRIRKLFGPAYAPLCHGQCFSFSSPNLQCGRRASTPGNFIRFLAGPARTLFIPGVLSYVINYHCIVLLHHIPGARYTLGRQPVFQHSWPKRVIITRVSQKCAYCRSPPWSTLVVYNNDYPRTLLLTIVLVPEFESRRGVRFRICLQKI